MEAMTKEKDSKTNCIPDRSRPDRFALVALILLVLVPVVDQYHEYQYYEYY